MSQKTNISDDTIDLKELLISLILQWKLIVLCIILSLILAFTYLKVTPETYATDALVQVEDSKSAASAALLGDLGSLTGGIGNAKSPADAEREILNSRLILGQVIENLNLNIEIINPKNTIVNRLFSSSKDNIFYSSNGVSFKQNQQTFLIEKLDVPRFYLDKKLTLRFNNTNKTFQLLYKDDVVFDGALNKNNQKTDSKGIWNVQINTSTPFDQEFEVIKFALPTAVERLKSIYAVAEQGKSTGVLGLKLEGRNPEQITEILNNILNVYQAQNIDRQRLESKQTLSFLDTQLPKLKNQLEESEREFNKFREQHKTVDVTQESELFLKQSIQLETMRMELQQKQAELSAKYTESHPLMAEINAQLATVNNKIKELNSTLQNLPELQRVYMQLYRDVQVQTQLYTELKKSYQQLQVSQAGEIGKVRIIDTAVEPIKPIKPKKLIILVLSIFVGGFIGVVIALLRNMLHSGITDSATIETEFDLPVYATVPRSPVQESRMSVIKKKNSLPILAVKYSDDVAIESLRSIRTAIHFALSGAKNNIIMVSGATPEAGKSFISMNLTAIFAQGNKRILLIDADLRRGYLHKYFSLSTAPGLSEYLSEQNTLESIIHETPVNNLSFISRGKSPKNPSELLSSEQFSDLLTTLSAQFDYIILDTPPVLAVTDSIIISQFAGVNLVVARYAKTQLKELELTVNRFNQAGSKVNGFILNDIHRSAGGGTGYSYNYAYKAHKDD